MLLHILGTREPPEPPTEVLVSAEIKKRRKTKKKKEEEEVDESYLGHGGDNQHMVRIRWTSGDGMM